jgi:FtsH-binding integral membrane protein
VARKIAYWFALALLAFTAVVGIRNSVIEWGDAANAFQKSVMIGVFAYGLFGFTTLYAVLRHRRWARYSAIAWAVAVTYVPGAAVMAYTGEDAMLSSALASSAGAALIAAFVLWAVRQDGWVIGRIEP